MAVESKSNRWDLRVAESEDQLVRAAAGLTGANLTRFVRDAAMAEANRVLADRRHFELSVDDWKRFNELLDREPQVPAGLRHLFSTPSVFDE